MANKYIIQRRTASGLETVAEIPALESGKVDLSWLPVVGSMGSAIIERGDNANGEYIRWADGTQVCWKTLPYTIAANSMTSWGSIYAASINRIYLGEFPAVFVEKPFVNISVSILGTSSAASSSSFWVAYSGNELTATSGGSCTLCRGNQLTATLNFDIIVIAIGRWK